MTFLKEILELKKKRVEAAKAKGERQNAKIKRPSHLLRTALSDENKIHIIAEIKRASPSKGIINDKIDVAEVAKMYERGGAAAISVLTEEDKFCGSLDDLEVARSAVEIPILRKDFVYDEFQIHEAKAVGADVILLIVAMLDDDKLLQLRQLAEDELDLDALVEVHTKEELDRAIKIGATLIGVNNRDLHSFKVSLDASRELIKFAPKDSLMIAESGLKTKEDLLELQALGYRGFLIGETLMRSGNAETELEKLTSKK
ncbi:MAG TPA: indole-3-glycerol phosphate synthase TrpC [Pyrinomonadaceae bacterium]|nr:indole-3-glycerol phosphate synthase TrpC [Pyrinomonadaceae bacterium]